MTGLTNEDGILTFTDDIAGVGAYTTSKEGDYVSVTNPLSDCFPFDQISEFTDAEGNVFGLYGLLNLYHLGIIGYYLIFVKQAA